jgi:hypothetical protein
MHPWRAKDSRDEVLRSADFIRFTTEEGKRLPGTDRQSPPS